MSWNASHAGLTILIEPAVQAYFGRASAYFRIRPPSWIWQLWRIGARKYFPREQALIGKNGLAGRGEGKEKCPTPTSPPLHQSFTSQASKMAARGIANFIHYLAFCSKITHVLQANFNPKTKKNFMSALQPIPPFQQPLLEQVCVEILFCLTVYKREQNA